MPSIDIRHPHDKTPSQVRTAIDEMAGRLAEKFGVTSAWDGDTLNFSRSGVDGQIAVEPTAVRVTAQLGFLLSAMKGTVESEIRRVLAEKFG